MSHRRLERRIVLFGLLSLCLVSYSRGWPWPITLLSGLGAALFVTTPERGKTLSMPIFLQDREAEGW
jgi:hypothetical protein